MAFKWPVTNVNISQGFGGNAEYYRQFGYGGHNGIDLAVPAGTPIFAANSFCNMPFSFNSSNILSVTVFIS